MAPPVTASDFLPLVGVAVVVAVAAVAAAAVIFSVTECRLPIAWRQLVPGIRLRL